jgi:hypothetical protein
MTKSDKSKIHTVSIIIQWHEEDAEQAARNTCTSNGEATSVFKQLKAGVPHNDKQEDIQDRGTQRSSKRLLPSDRVVLDALRARVPRKKQVTIPVRTRELMATCGISRRQVQICLKRLTEQGLITRILDNVGRQDGYQYLLSQSVFQR